MTQAHTYFRVVSFNTENRAGEDREGRFLRIKKMATFVSSMDPVILCLQEVLEADHHVWEEALEPYDARFASREDMGRNSEGLSTFLLTDSLRFFDTEAFWLSATPDIPSLSWNAAHYRIALTTGIASAERRDPLFWLINLHLDHRSRLARRESLKLVRDRVRGYVARSPQEVMVCGDFNSRPGAGSLRRFRDDSFAVSGPSRYPLRDAALVQPLRALLPTFSGWGRFRLGPARLDYILHSDHFRVLDYGVRPANDGRERLSDHHPVAADFLLARDMVE